MTLFKSSRLLVLGSLLLLIGFAGASYGSVRFDVVPSPTEVVNTGRSEVTGSVNLIVRGAGNVTGTSTGGDVQIGLIYTNPAMQIDNTTSSGIRIFFSSGFSAANPRFLTTDAISNRDVNGRCSGFITINLGPGATPAEGDFIRIEGVRGRIDASLAITPGTDLFVDLQSINDPTANSFTPDRVRVAKSLDGMNVEIASDSLLLCFPTLGKVDAWPQYYITIWEGFARAFVDADANNDGTNINDRVDSGGQAGILTTGPSSTTAQALGSPTNSTQFIVWLEGIPSSVDYIDWDDTVSEDYGYGSWLRLVSSTSISSAGVATATYSFETPDQTSMSDQRFETFTLQPIVALKTSNQTATGSIYAAVAMAPTTSAASGCSQPSSSPSRPRFLQMYESDAVATNNPPDDPTKLYAQVVRCNCFLLFTYVTYSGPTDADFNTGIAVANTTGDEAPFGDGHAPDQLGKITFYFYDSAQGYVGSTTTSSEIGAGKTFITLLNGILPSGVQHFAGYIIAKAEFQFCHALAYIADQKFGKIAHGYLANVIPDPAIKGWNTGGVRSASAAGDIYNMPAGESLNN